MRDQCVAGSLPHLRGERSIEIEISLLLAAMDVIDEWPDSGDIAESAVSNGVSKVIEPLANVPEIRHVLETHGWVNDEFTVKPSSAEIKKVLFNTMAKMLRVNMKHMTTETLERAVAASMKERA